MKMTIAPIVSLVIQRTIGEECERLSGFPKSPTGWIHLIETDEHAGLRALNRLARAHHAAFIDVCHMLLDAEPTLVRRAALRMLATLGERGDSIALAAARTALADPILRSWALLTLDSLGGPEVFDILFKYAQQGYHQALRAAANHARTEDERAQVLALAWTYTLATTFALRQSALWIVLPTLSAFEKEEVLLAVAGQYSDEIALNMLGRHATPRVLPALRYMLEQFGPEYAEHKDVARAITMIEKRVESRGDNQKADDK